jgi:hypothetical protein
MHKRDVKTPIFLANLKVNKKYLAQQKTSFSTSRAGDNPSTKPSSPKDLLIN